MRKRLFTGCGVLVLVCLAYGHFYQLKLSSIREAVMEAYAEELMTGDKLPVSNAHLKMRLSQAKHVFGPVTYFRILKVDLVEDFQTWTVELETVRNGIDYKETATGLPPDYDLFIQNQRTMQTKSFP